MPPIRRTLAATRTLTTTLHLGSTRDVGEMSAHGEFGPANSDSILWRVRPKRLGSERMKFNVCLSVNKAFYSFCVLLIDLFPH